MHSGHSLSNRPGPSQYLRENNLIIVFVLIIYNSPMRARVCPSVVCMRLLHGGVDEQCV